MSNCTYARTSEEVQRMYSTVGQMDNCEGLFASWATDPAALKAVLPEPLAMMAPVVTVYSVNVYDANFASPYREAALIIPVLCNGTPGLYPVSFMLEGADNAVFVGRDQLGMPKKNADKINLWRSGDMIHTDITRLGRKILDLDMEIGEYNDPMANQIFGDRSDFSTPQDGIQYFYKCDMAQDAQARISVDNVRLLSYHGSMDYQTWENASIVQAICEPSDSDPWAMFPVAKPLGGSWTKLSISLLGTQAETPIEATDELVGKLLSGKYDSPQFGYPTRML